MPAHFSYRRDGHLSLVIGMRSGTRSEATLTKVAIPNGRWMNIVDVIGRDMSIPKKTPCVRYRFIVCSCSTFPGDLVVAIGFVRLIHLHACLRLASLALSRYSPVVTRECLLCTAGCLVVTVHCLMLTAYRPRDWLRTNSSEPATGGSLDLSGARSRRAIGFVRHFLACAYLGEWVRLALSCCR